MSEDMNEIKGLMLPPEHLQDLIDKMDSGIEVAMSDLEKLECKKYLQIMSREIFDNDDEDDGILTKEEERRRQELIRQHIEEAKRKAHKDDVTIIKLTSEQMAELEDDMSVSFVRPNPDTLYNKTDDQLYKSVEEKILSDKLARIRNCYYDAEEWRRVMDVIKEGIEFELRSNKFAYLGSIPKRFEAFNKGKLKLQVQIPKLYLNRISPVSDPEVLKGVYNGDITVVDRQSINNNVRHKSYKNSPIVHMQIPTIGSQEYQYYVNMHRKGFQTPLSGAIKAKSTIYDRYVDKDKKTIKPFGILDKNGVPIEYDWLKLGAQEYYRMLHNIKPNIEDIIENVQKANGGKLNKQLLERMNILMHTDPNGFSTERVEPNWISASVQVKPDVVKLEQDLLNAIQITNP